MKKYHFLIAMSALIFLLSNCSRKTTPENSSRSVYGSENSKTTNTSAPKAVSTKPIRTAVPKVIAVNDSIAKKTFDGRLYYDLEGHRYWRNYKDGKYYLFNKSMATDPAFKKP